MDGEYEIIYTPLSDDLLLSWKLNERLRSLISSSCKSSIEICFNTTTSGSFYIDGDEEVPFRLHMKSDKELYLVETEEDISSLHLYGTIAGRVECMGSEVSQSDALRQRSVEARQVMQNQKTAYMPLSSLKITKKRPYAAVDAPVITSTAKVVPKLSHLSADSCPSCWVCLEALPINQPSCALTISDVRRFFGGLSLLDSCCYLLSCSDAAADVFVGFVTESGANLALLRQGEELRGGLAVRRIRAVTLAEAFWVQAMCCTSRNEKMLFADILRSQQRRKANRSLIATLPSPLCMVQHWPTFSAYLDNKLSSKSLHYYSKHTCGVLSTFSDDLVNSRDDTDMDAHAILREVRCLWSEALIRLDKDDLEELARLDRGFSTLCKFISIPPHDTL